MLVKRSIVEKWYQRDSWIYKNFAYLFVNPLWEKHVPNGFTVCPYFWMSMFSFFIFRPLIVAPTQYLFRPLIRLGGKPFAWLDKAIYKAFDHFDLSNDSGYKQGYGFFFAAIMTFLVAVCVMGIGLCLWMVAQVHDSLDTTNQGVFLFWSAASFAALFGIIKLHKKITKTECKTMYYLLVWLLLFIPAIFVFIPHEASDIFGGIAFAFVHEAAGFFAWLWAGLCVIGTFLWSWTKVIGMWKPMAVLMLPWWGFIVLLTVFGWVADKICVYYDSEHKDYIFKTNPNEIYDAYRSAWVETLTRLFSSHPRWGKTDEGLDELTDDPFTFKAAKAYRYMLYRQTVELMWKDALEQLKLKYPTISKGVWDLVTSNDKRPIEKRFNIVQNALKDEHPAFPNMNEENFVRALEIIIQNDPEVIQLANTYRLEHEAAVAKQAAKKKSKSHLMCLKVTGQLANGFNGIGRAFKWIGVSIATFAVYMWMLIKAKKHGACPYFQFTDVTKTAPVIENNQPK